MLVQEVLTGVCFKVPSVSEFDLPSFGAIQSHLSKVSGVMQHQQILMTPQGQLAGPNLVSSPLLLFSKDMVHTIELPPVVYTASFKDKFGPPISAEVRGVVITERRLHEWASNFYDLAIWIDRASAQADAAKAHISLMSAAYRALLEYSSAYMEIQLSQFHKLQEKFISHRYEVTREAEAFDKAIELLEQIELAPGLKTQKRRCLSDLLDIPALKQWKEGYNIEVARLQVKFAEVEMEIKRTSRNSIKTPPLIDSYNDVNFGELARICSHVIEFYREYRGLCELYIFKNDAKAKAKLHQENWPQRLKALQVHANLAEELKEEADKHINHLLDLRNSYGSSLITALQQITETTAKIKNVVKSQVSMLNSLVNRSVKHLRYLVVPRLLPEAYQATLIEVSRRRVFRSKADAMLSRLKLLIENETNLRCEFLNSYRNVIPKNFIPQLSEGPMLDFKEDDPDRCLPDVNIALVNDEVNSIFHTELRSNYDEALVQIRHVGHLDRLTDIQEVLTERDSLKNELESLASSQSSLLLQHKLNSLIKGQPS